MLIWRGRPPTTTTWPTPLTLSSCRRSVLSAYSVMSRTGFFAETASVRTGAESGSNFSTVGCWIVFGRSGSTRLTRSRTSWAAMSASFSSRNEMMTCETPSDEFDRSSSMPLMVLTPSSILSVISVSTSSGAAPGSRVVTTTVGKSTFGKRSSPRRPKENAPMTVSERMRTLAKTGRLTEMEASHCMMRFSFCDGRSTSGATLFRSDGEAVRETFRLDGDGFALLEAARDLDQRTDRFAERHDPLLELLAREDVDPARAGGGLDGGSRNEERRGRLGPLDRRGRE